MFYWTRKAGTDYSLKSEIISDGYPLSLVVFMTITRRIFQQYLPAAETAHGLPVLKEENVKESSLNSHRFMRRKKIKKG